MATFSSTSQLVKDFHGKVCFNNSIITHYLYDLAQVIKDLQVLVLSSVEVRIITMIAQGSSDTKLISDEVTPAKHLIDARLVAQ